MNWLVAGPASLCFITIGTSGEHLVLCSIYRKGPAFQIIADFDLQVFFYEVYVYACPRRASAVSTRAFGYHML